jgi:hypothetical protein
LLLYYSKIIENFENLDNFIKLDEDKELEERKHAAEKFLKNKLLLEKKNMDDEFILRKVNPECNGYLFVFGNVVKHCSSFDQIDNLCYIIGSDPDLESFNKLINTKECLMAFQIQIVEIDNLNTELGNYDLSVRKNNRKLAKNKITIPNFILKKYS